MADGQTQNASAWVDRAALRFAECETEIRRLPADARPARKSKLEARRDHYVRLLDRLRRRLPKTTADDGVRDPAKIRQEVEALKDRIRGAAASLARDRGRLNDLRVRHPAGNGIDYGFEAPSSDASDAEKAVFAILRGLGL